MQLNAALPLKRVLRNVAAVPRRALSRSVGLTSCGVRRTRLVLSRSTSTVGVGRPSFGGRRKGSGRSRSGAFWVAKVLQRTRCLARSSWAACPSAVSARSWFAQAPRSTVRCSSAAALAARLGRSRSRSVALPLVSYERSCRFSTGSGKLAVMNATSFTSPSSANAASNPAFKRTSHGVPWAAAQRNVRRRSWKVESMRCKCTVTAIAGQATEVHPRSQRHGQFGPGGQ
jgi:hypothetical protein